MSVKLNQMKNYTYILLCCIIGTFSFAQNYNNDKISVVEEKLLFIDYTAAKVKDIPDNLVRINQLGSYNISKVAIKANESTVEVQQIGNENSVDIDISANKVEEKIIQIGNKNVYQDYNHLNKRYHGVDVYQKGDNQSIYLNGSNSISEKIKIKQIGSYKTIRINSYY